MLKNIFAIIAIFVIGMVGGIFASQILWPYLVKGQISYQPGLEQGPVYLTETKQIYIQENVALVNAVERAEKTVVGVKTQTQTGKVLEGSGLIVTSDGLIVTLAELVPYGSNFSFFVNDKKVSFQILKRDLKENLALIKISDSTLTTASFARLEKLKIGERVFLIGATFENETPSKLGEEDESSSLPTESRLWDEGKEENEVPFAFVVTRVVNEGIVKTFDENFIQTNILESGLLTGSPLFNIEGEILGINTIDSKGKVIAISISKIRAFIGI